VTTSWSFILQVLTRILLKSEVRQISSSVTQAHCPFFGCTRKVGVCSVCGMIIDRKNNEILRQKTSWVSLVRFVVDTSNVIWENSGFRHENPAHHCLAYGAARRTLLQSGRTGVVNCAFSQWIHHHQIQLCQLCNNVLLPVSCACWPGNTIIRLRLKINK